MDTKELPQVDELDKLPEQTRRDLFTLRCQLDDDGVPFLAMEAHRFEELALENARLRGDMCAMVAALDKMADEMDRGGTTPSATDLRLVSLAERGDLAKENARLRAEVSRLELEKYEDAMLKTVLEERDKFAIEVTDLEQECAQLREELASIDSHVSKSPSSRPPKGTP